MSMGGKPGITPYTVRFPADVHAAIKEAAEADERSINSWIVITLREAAAKSARWRR